MLWAMVPKSLKTPGPAGLMTCDIREHVSLSQKDLQVVGAASVWPLGSLDIGQQIIGRKTLELQWDRVFGLVG